MQDGIYSVCEVQDMIVIAQMMGYTNWNCAVVALHT